MLVAVTFWGRWGRSEDDGSVESRRVQTGRKTPFKPSLSDSGLILVPVVDAVEVALTLPTGFSGGNIQTVDAPTLS